MGVEFWLSLTVFLITVAISLEIVIGVRKIKQLEDTAPVSAPAGDAPKVSIIVSALNEAETIEPALLSLLAIDYPNLEIIAINDRSTDATPEILDRIAKTHPGLRVLHLSTLPPGWLGKNHALYQGAQLASGSYLLFTDADVIFEPSSISRAVNYCELFQVDHLAILFKVIAKTQLLRMLLVLFQIGVLARYKPWKVATSTKHFLGIGGFNMVRKSAYEESGGHAALALQVLDDLMLGKLIKAKGYCQHVLSTSKLITVEWYQNTPGMVKGLQKNIFCAFAYQISQLIGMTLFILVLRFWPLVGLFVTDGVTRMLNAASVLASCALCVDIIRRNEWEYRCLLFAPIAMSVELLMWWRSCLLTLLRGGIDWRGTHYPLRDLRQAQLKI
ncbi:glycosyltransferase [Solimicrobium silvestre]|uniref:Glycosyl transferase family 2 n=1 Tax=Solimicrobium silvestre TaxID=2099400 RepID=A0A2S9GXH8_9BURK|nr:glycosyltransferase [Solimicrobium silvestre]PRC92425.1 Glycosyl transferase family 2 [Solimicrobium silvestre]